MLIEFLQFVLQLILAGALLRFLQVKASGTSIGNALAFVY